MYKRRVHYWSNSKFAKYILSKFNIPAPIAMTMQEWNEYEEKYRNSTPYKIVKIFNKIQNFFYFPFDVILSCKVYLKNRFLYKTHLLKTGLEPGLYHEFEDKVLHGVFNELVDFIEIEKASCNFDFEETFKERHFSIRNSKKGLDYLNWEINQSHSESQQQSAKQQLELYLWWKEERPKRDISFPKVARGKMWSHFSEEDRKAAEEWRNKMDFFFEEDTEKLTQLIKIRQTLWT